MIDVATMIVNDLTNMTEFNIEVGEEEEDSSGSARDGIKEL